MSYKLGQTHRNIVILSLNVSFKLENCFFFLVNLNFKAMGH